MAPASKPGSFIYVRGCLVGFNMVSIMDTMSSNKGCHLGPLQGFDKEYYKGSGFHRE